VNNPAAGTQETSAAAQEQTASMDQLVNAAQELAKLSEELQAEVNKFKLDNDASATPGKMKICRKGTVQRDLALKSPAKLRDKSFGNNERAGLAA